MKTPHAMLSGEACGCEDVVESLAGDELADLEPHTKKVVAKLKSKDMAVRYVAVKTLWQARAGSFGAICRSPSSPSLRTRIAMCALRRCLRLASSSRQFWRRMPPPSSRSLQSVLGVRAAALQTLGKLEPAVLSQYRASITQWKERERNRDVLRVAAQVGADTWPRSVPVRPRHPRLLAEGDSDEESDMEAAIMRAAEAGGAPASRGVGATSESGRSSAQGERKRSAPGGGAPSPQDRAKMAKISDVAAALGGSGAGVQEKDLVLLLHSQGPMELSELIAKFKPFMPTKPEQAAFMALMKNVAILLVEKGVKLARLRKPETKAAYGLD